MYPVILTQVRHEDVERAISKDRLSWRDFLNLLSETALDHLEPMAQKARQLTIQYFRSYHTALSFRSIFPIIAATSAYIAALTGPIK